MKKYLAGLLAQPASYGRLPPNWSNPRPENLAEPREKRLIVPVQVPEYSKHTVFLNIPYDDRFRRLYLAYISGLVHLGLDPRATIEIPGGQNRLDKILELIRSCRYSIHDLSRVQLDRTPPATPRFNMPFELGLAVASAKLDSAPHDWFVFETVHRRASKSLSDLSGTDPNIHHGTVEGVMRELCNAFVRHSRQERYSVPGMLKTYRAVSLLVEDIKRKTRAQSVFEARVFYLLCSAAGRAAGIPETH
jgi:hypothetical protein